MGHLSKNEKLRELQKENEQLKKQIAKYQSGDGYDEPEDGSPDGLFDPNDYSVSDLKAALQEIDDPEVLDQILELEQSGENRKTAVEAIDKRLIDVREQAPDS